MIELTGVAKSFGQNHVLRGVDLKIPTGTSMVIIGGSGTGKSVLLKSILGLVRPDSGTITLDGQDVTKGDRDAFLARFGMLFQGGALFDSMRVWENVAFRLMRGALKKPKAEAHEIAIEKLRRVGLGPQVADLYPAELSGGMQKRVGLARAIAANPEVIVASGMGEARPEWLDQWSRWPQLEAARRDNLFFIPPELIQRHTPRILDGAARLCGQVETARKRRGGASAALTPPAAPAPARAD